MTSDMKAIETFEFECEDQGWYKPKREIHYLSEGNSNN